MSDREQILKRLRELIDEARAMDPGLLSEMRALVLADSQSTRPPEAEGWHGMIGSCAAMMKVQELVRKFAPAALPVLLNGESGTGKDLVARALHAESPRCRESMISENCAAIPETLLESTLFGHKRGSFTGAVRDHAGHFVAANKGTLFLDEVGDMSLAMQAKLLRVLQEGEVRPVGGSHIRKVDVRVIAATNKNLEQMVADGSFREDLFYRLNVLQIELPPLRDREGDIVVLAERFLDNAARKAGRQISLSDEAREAIANYRWPGNVRQVQNEMQRLAAISTDPVVALDDLSVELRAG